MFKKAKNHLIMRKLKYKKVIKKRKGGWGEGEKSQPPHPTKKINNTTDTIFICLKLKKLRK